MSGSGDFKDRVGFFQPAAGDDGYGNTTIGFPDWPDFTVAAAIVPKLGGEAVLAGRLTGKNYVNVTVWRSSQSSQVTTNWRARNEKTGELLNIRSIIDPDQKRQKLEMLCEVGVAA